MKKLVKINEKTGYYAELDFVKLGRTANALKTKLVSLSSDQVGERERDFLLDLCNKSLAGSISAPIERSALPLRYQLREQMLPRDLDEALSSFYVAITGMPTTELELQDINGEIFAEVEFENLPN